ncbi:MAG: cell filamentation protein Fic, partial [Bacilli bacterium]
MIKNKLNIDSSSELANVEEKLTKKKALELFDKKILDTLEAGTFETLCFIHKYLFEDIYDFAGVLRDVNIAKGNFRFTSVIYLEASIRNINL